MLLVFAQVYKFDYDRIYAVVTNITHIQRKYKHSKICEYVMRKFQDVFEVLNKVDLCTDSFTKLSSLLNITAT